MIITSAILLIFGLVGVVISWGEHYDRVMLQEIQVLTLKHAEMTTTRRSSPVPQLKCVGGSAQGKFTPAVVQCYNRGWDGRNVQWECKCDMDNKYRFGEVKVECEGFDSPGDTYILAGSCGLKYTLDITLEGIEKISGHEYFRFNDSEPEVIGAVIGAFILLAVLVVFGVGCVIQALYERFVDGMAMGDMHHFADLNRHFAHFDQLFAQLNQQMDQQFVRMDQEIAQLNLRIANLDRRIAHLESARGREASSSGTRPASGFGGTTIR